MEILVKTIRGMEPIVASLIEDLIPESKCVAKPKGFLGLVLVSTSLDVKDASNLINLGLPEAEKVIPIYASCRAKIDEIVKNAADIARENILSTEKFAVRTTRRGRHEFTSIDVNVRVGEAVRKATGASVDLEFPDKIVWVEIIGEKVYISVTSGSIEYKKLNLGKPLLGEFTKSLIIGQIPYTGPIDAAENMGRRIGRAMQTFEVGELVLTPVSTINAFEMYYFLKGLFEGIESRYRIQKKTYNRYVHKVPVSIENLYLFVRRNRDKPIIVTSTKGKAICDVADKIYDIFTQNKKVIVLIGAREGIPTGIFRFSDLVVDLAPTITISTDYAGVATVIALITILEKMGYFERYKGKKATE